MTSLPPLRRKLALRPLPPRARWNLWLSCCRGAKPAELLPTKDREDLVWQLSHAGWSDVQIAELTHMTTYTAARIRARLGLTPGKGA